MYIMYYVSLPTHVLFCDVKLMKPCSRNILCYGVLLVLWLLDEFEDVLCIWEIDCFAKYISWNQLLNLSEIMEFIFLKALMLESVNFFVNVGWLIDVSYYCFVCNWRGDLTHIHGSPLRWKTSYSFGCLLEEVIERSSAFLKWWVLEW